MQETWTNGIFDQHETIDEEGEILVLVGLVFEMAGWQTAAFALSAA